jgi:hypothetical protein
MPLDHCRPTQTVYATHKFFGKITVVIDDVWVEPAQPGEIAIINLASDDRDDERVQPCPTSITFGKDLRQNLGSVVIICEHIADAHGLRACRYGNLAI